MTSWAGSATLGRIFYVSILHGSFSYALHVSTRSFVCTLHMSYMNLREFCMCLFFICLTWIYENFVFVLLHVYFSYVLHESTRILMCLFCLWIFCMSYMNLQELCMCLFCMCIFCMSYKYPLEVAYVYFVRPTSYMNLQEFCMCPFCIHIFNMLYMYPQEVVYVYFVCPTWIYKNLICVNFTCVFFVCPTCIHKKLYVYISYDLHESTINLYLAILLVYLSYVLYMNLREFCVFDFPCIFFVCPTWIYENYACVYFALVFFVCPTCIHKTL